MSEAVKLFKAKVKELAAFVESNEADSYLSAEFLARLTELRELTEIIKIDLANERKRSVPVFAPNSVYVPVEPEENLAPLVIDETPVKTKTEQKAEVQAPVELVAEVVDAKDSKELPAVATEAEKAPEPVAEKTAAVATKAKTTKN